MLTERFGSFADSFTHSSQMYAFPESGRSLRIETGVENSVVQKMMLEQSIKTDRLFPPFKTWTRISMFAPEDMKYFAQVFRKLLA